MRWGRAVAVIGAAIALSGSEQITTILPGSLACGGAEAPLCQSVARLAIAQMNLTAAGPIEAVALESFDCVKGAKSHFHSEWATATTCWNVTVTGDRSHGWGVVVHWPDGSLEPFW
jgi:hypothetical protein